MPEELEPFHGRDEELKNSEIGGKFILPPRMLTVRKNESEKKLFLRRQRHEKQT